MIEENSASWSANEDPGVPRPDLPGGLDTAAVGQADVHDDHVRTVPVGRRDGRPHRLRLSDHHNVLVDLQQSTDAVPHDLVIVDHQHAKEPADHARHACMARSGAARN